MNESMNIIKTYQTVFTDCQRSWGKVMLSQVSVILLGRGSRVSLVPGHFLAPCPMSFPKEGRLSLAPDHFLGIYQWRIYIVKFFTRAPPGVQILSISCSFWENLAKSYVGAPWRVGAPSSGKSWIRHCIPMGLGYSGVRVSGGRALGVRYTQGWVRCTQGR